MGKKSGIKIDVDKATALAKLMSLGMLNAEGLDAVISDLTLLDQVVTEWEEARGLMKLFGYSDQCIAEMEYNEFPVDHTVREWLQDIVDMQGWRLERCKGCEYFQVKEVKLEEMELGTEVVQ
jgi:hypothetical protein